MHRVHYEFHSIVNYSLAHRPNIRTINQTIISSTACEVSLSLSTMADVSFTEVANLPYKKPTKSFSYGDEPMQTAEYWTAEATPTASTATTLLVLLIHGGCWLNDYDKSHVRPLAAALVERGLAVMSIEYRRTGDPGAGWPGTFDDLRAALNAAVKLKHSAIIAVGHSAGGHLALWLAAVSGTQLKGVVGLAAISDLVLYAKGTSECEKATLQLMGGTPELHPNRYQTASPLLMTSNAPILLIHGSHDQVVNVQQSEQFANRPNNLLAKPSTDMLTKKQPTASLHVLEGRGHYDLIDPRQEVPDIIADQARLWFK